MQENKYETMKTTLFELWLAGLAMIGTTACDPPAEMNAEEAAAWIAAYAPERIDTGSPIRIELTDSVRHLYPDTPLGKILKFTPSVKGELYLAEPRMLEFAPQEGALKPGGSNPAANTTASIRCGTSPSPFLSQNEKRGCAWSAFGWIRPIPDICRPKGC